MTIPTLPPLERTSPSFAADLDAFFLTQLPATIPAFNAEIERVNQFAFGSYSATSSTSLTVGTGSKTLTIEAGKGFTVGQPVLIASTASPTNYMSGQVTAYNSTTGAMTVNVTNIGGSGTVAAWTVSVSAAVLATAPSLAQRTITSADTLIASDQGKLINCSGTFTLAVTAAATLGNGWWCYVRDTGTGVITLDPAGSETVDGVTSGQVRDTILLACNGTSFTAMKVGPRSVIDVLTSGTSWTAPLGVRRVRARGVGGGGGGGRGAGDTPTDMACGGSGAGTFDVTVTVTPGTAYTYAIGAAGTAAASGNTAGNAGGATTLAVNGTTYTANGGNGGPIASNYQIDGGTATNGRINTPGGQGYVLSNSTSYLSFGGDSEMGVGGKRVGSSTSESSGYGSGGRGGFNSAVAGVGRPGVLVLEY